jgi:aminocarboxymuconate-semialdehyde decarboxylase
MIVDIHAHYFPQEYVEKINELHPRLAHLMGSRRRPGAGGDQAELDMRFEAMDTAGVDMQILSSASNFPYLENKRDAVFLAREANDLFAILVERYPDRFRALAVLPLPHVDASLRELERVLDELGMVGVIIGASVMGRSPCEPEYDPIFAELDRRGAILMGHARQFSLDAPLLVDYPPVNALAGPAFENTLFALHLLRRQIAQRFPRMKIVLNHLGGALPVLFERMDFAGRILDMQASWVADGSAGAVVAPGSITAVHEPPSATLRRMYLETATFGDVAALEAACKTFGADRIVLGTDWPYSAYDYPGLVNYPKEAAIPERDAVLILRNAATLLGLVDQPAGTSG